MATLGFVLLTHNKPHQVTRLIHRLLSLFDNPPIACHHDFGQSDLDEKRFPSCVRFVHPHLATAWGRFSQVEATIAGLRRLYDGPDAPDWFTLLSGTDYPIAPASAIRADLEGGAVDAFLNHHPVDPARVECDWHRTCLHRYLRKQFNIYYLNRRLRWSWRPILLPRTLSWPFLPFSRRFRCYAGWTWFTANRKCAHYILDWHDNNPALARHYARGWCTDESYFQCILCNEPSFRIANDNKRYVTWQAGSPHPDTLGSGDLPAILASKCHFARKFDMDQDPAVLDALDEVLG